ncbi:serine/threonine-protein kinase [Actinomadura sp. NPDC047616]|uniref:WD40 repeat domain-containing serine/threonine protein kinase n=1 Tax=Actinomadura sp. NPDC047616 TaxID=3155914 RepID=UPI0033D896B7
MQPLETSDPVQIGHYRMLAQLGRGGMGRVLLGGGPDGRLVAVKLVDEQFVNDDGFRARFRREVRASRKVAGAYTAAVIDADAEAPEPWLASVYVPGPSLREVIDTIGPLAAEPALRLAAGLAAALIEVHRAELVHRDLKPSNVLLTDDGLRVIDFGIARATEIEDGTQVTRTGALVGTPGFMSPEQALGQALTTASDIFSLGSVLVYACTGRGPFHARNTPQTLHNVIHADPVLGTLPDRLRDIVPACLAKDPAARPKPADLLNAIGEVAPAARPWPAPVHELIARQDAEVARLLRAPEPQVPYGPPRVPPGVPPASHHGSHPGVPPASHPGVSAGPQPSLHPGVPPGVSYGVPPGVPAGAPGGVGMAQPPGPGGGRPGGAAPARPDRRRVLLMAGGGAVLGLSAIGGTIAWALRGDDKPEPRRSGASGGAAASPLATLTGHAGSIHYAEFNPSGELLVTAGEDGTVRLWDVSARQISGEPLKVAAESARKATFDRVGELLATASVDGAVKLWDVKTRRQVGETLGVPMFDFSDRPGPVSDVTFSPDGDTLAAAGTKMLQMWDTDSRDKTGTLTFDKVNLMTQIAFSGDGRLLAIPDDQLIRVWDAGSRKQVGQSLLGHTAKIAHAVMSPDGRTLATGGWDTTIRLWDIQSRTPIGQPMRGHSHVIQGLAFSHDGRFLASVSHDATARLWDVAKRAPIGKPLTSGVKTASAVAFSPDGRLLATAGDKTVFLWNVADRTSS